VRCSIIIGAFILLFGGTTITRAQSDDLPDASTRSGRPTRRDTSQGVVDMLAKQRLEREKKEHQELLDRGDEALRIAKQLEMAYEQNRSFSQQDRAKLDYLERVVTKIRKELGADDDDNATDPEDSEDEPRPTNLEEGFKYLQSTANTLVDELKKSTRFSISVVAVQSSNTVLKLVRFLRIKK
jgi:hypothetical protein